MVVTCPPDINSLRWLAIRRNELIDKLNQISPCHSKPKGKKPMGLPPQFFSGLERHFWIRIKSADLTGFLTEFLETRGVS